MNLHEYQAKEILEHCGVPVPPFRVVKSHGEVERAIKELNLTEAVVKIQVHAGGRGKAGGVKIAKSHKEIMKVAAELIGMKMVNNQTGPQGVIASKVMIGPVISIKKEYYLGAIIDREMGQPILIASPQGGMEIEEIAKEKPEMILKLPINLDGTIRPFRLHRLAKFMGWSGETAKSGMSVAKGVAKAFVQTDASLLEINPLIEDPHGKIWALDAKISIDDNALFRQPKLAAFFDPSQVDPNEVLAKEFDLAYIALDGNIGCMVNGAGLAMATMDIIKYAGGKPANFLDVGGGATKEKVEAGFKIVLSDPKVKAVLINIFGGIMNCATIAEGVIAAAYDLSIKVPLVVRMEGTNVEMGKKLLHDSKLPIITAEDLADAANKVVSSIKG